MSYRVSYLTLDVENPEITTPVSGFPTAGYRKIYVKSTGKIAILDSAGNEETAALDSAVVHDTGDETVAGIKTFSSFPISPNAMPTTALQFTNKQYVDSILGNADALVFKGIFDASMQDVPAADAGDVYKVTVAGNITGSGIVCEVGDLIICTVDGSLEGQDANWVVVQTNIDGAVTGPVSSTNNNIAVFDGVTGKVIKDGGSTISTILSTAQGYADAKVSDAIVDGVTSVAPSQNAVYDALAGKEPTIGYTPENVANKSSDTNLGVSNTLYPTQGAVKSYVDTAVSGLTTDAFTVKVSAGDPTAEYLGTSIIGVDGNTVVDIYSPTGSNEKVRVDIGVNVVTLTGSQTLSNKTLLSTIVTKAAGDSPYTVAATDEIILANAVAGAITINLPAVASSNGRRITVKKIDTSANIVTVDGNGAETIDGVATDDIMYQNDSFTYVCNGSAWYMV